MSFEARGRLPGAFETLRLPIAVAAVVALAVVGLALLPDPDPPREVALVSPSASAIPTMPGSAPPDARPSPRPPALPFPWVALEPGRHDLPFFAQGGPWASEALIRLTVPAGWAANASGTMLERYPDGGPTLRLAIDRVASVRTDACDPAAGFVDVGPTADELVAALSAMTGVTRSGPTDVTVDGHPARRLSLAIPFPCPGPEGRWLWEDSGGRKLGLLKDGSATVTVVDLGGKALAIAVSDRDAASWAVAEVRGIVESIEFEPLCAGPAQEDRRCSVARPGAAP